MPIGAGVASQSLVDNRCWQGYSQSVPYYSQSRIEFRSGSAAFICHFYRLGRRLPGRSRVEGALIAVAYC